MSTAEPPAASGSEGPDDGEPRPGADAGPPTEPISGGPDTEPIHPGPDTEAMPPVDATAVAGPMPEGPAGATATPPPARWSARAQVRPAGADEGGQTEWEDVGPPPRGPMTPLLIVAGILVLAVLVGLGVWLALGERGSTPVPATTTTPAPTSSAPATTAAPTTTPPTTATTTADATEPAVEAIPEVRGSDFDTAAAALTQLGFAVVRVDQASDDVPDGRVIGTDPPAGTLAVVGQTTIRILVSTGPAEPTIEPTTIAPS